MSFPKYDEIVPKALLSVTPDRYKTKPYHRLTIGEIITITDITIVSYKAKNKTTGDYIVRKDGSNVLNQTIYFGLDNGSYTSIRNDTVLGQVASITGWTEDGEKENYYSLENPETVKIVEITTTIGKGDNSKTIPIKVLSSVE